MDYLPTLDEKWPHSRGNVGKYSRPMEHLGHSPPTLRFTTDTHHSPRLWFTRSLVHSSLRRSVWSIQGGQYDPVINGVITSLSRVINPSYPFIKPFIGAPCTPNSPQLLSLNCTFQNFPSFLEVCILTSKFSAPNFSLPHIKYVLHKLTKPNQKNPSKSSLFRFLLRLTHQKHLKIQLGVSKNRGRPPKMDGFFMENPIKMDDLGGFTTPIFGNTWKHPNSLGFPHRFGVPTTSPGPPKTNPQPPTSLN